jgi:predicted metal-dependent enzyme (double-stranded beta helix superfamily)
MGATDVLVAQCEVAVADSDPRGALRAVLERAVTDRALATELTMGTVGLNVLHRSAGLTVLNVIWPPRFTLYPHDHRMWAAIAIYAGRENNTFFRRDHGTIVPSGGKDLEERAVQFLGDDVIHSVENPNAAHTGGIHVYAGDFVATERSQWDPATLEEQPYDMAATQQFFADAEERFRSEG